jgi:Heavy metal associated domain 2
MSFERPGYPQVLHQLPGRIRVWLPVKCSQAQRDAVVATLCKVDGVHQVRVGAHTGNTLVNFDPRVISQATIVNTLSMVTDGLPSTEQASESLVAPKQGQRGRISAKSRGYSLPVAEALATKLRDRPNVTQVKVDRDDLQLVVHYQGGAESVTDVVATVARSESSQNKLGPLPSDDGHIPLRLAGATIECGVLLVRQLGGLESRGRLQAGSLAISFALCAVECAPGPRSRLERLFGPDGATILLETADLCCALLSGGWLGLVLGSVSAVRLAKTLATTTPNQAVSPRADGQSQPVQTPRRLEKTLA